MTDGPLPESKEFLAGYWLVDVESEERAIEIAARTSAAPGPGGKPVAGDRDRAVRHYRSAAERTTSIAERDYLTARAARLDQTDKPPSSD